MFMPCSPCCGQCTILDDNFNRADSADPGADWAIDSGDWEIEDNTLYAKSYPGLIASVAGPGSIVVESVSYIKSSRVSVGWLPIADAIPSIHRLHIGYIDPGAPNEVRDSFFLQVEAGVRSPNNTIVVRLGVRGLGVESWLTDELPIGWADSQYTGEVTVQPDEPYFSLTLCWEPDSAYGPRDVQKVKATITSYTGAHYTLEGTHYAAFGLANTNAILEAVEGHARWEDFRFRLTKPDTTKCPWCGGCLFSADMTTPDDQGTAAYSSSGGTFSRNVTTGALELTGTTATWLVDVPARNSLSLTYGADWGGSSPAFTVNAGAVSVAITKSGSNQLVTPTIDGSLQGGFTVPLGSSSLAICVASGDVTINVGGTQEQYTCDEAAGYTNISYTASGSMVTLSEIRVQRTDSQSVSRFGCQSCVLETPPDCSVCPPEPFAPFGAMAIHGEFSIEPKTRKGRGVASGFELSVGDPCVKQSITPADISCEGQEWPSDVIAETAETSLTFGTDLRRNVGDISLCTFDFSEQLCTNCCETSIGNVRVTAGIYVTLFRTNEAIPRFYLASAARLVNWWPIEGTTGSYVIFDCVEGVVAAIDVDVEAYGFGDYGGIGLLGWTTEHILADWPHWYSDYFTDCDKVDFVLTGPGGTVRNLFQTTTYPTELTVHVIR